MTTVNASNPPRPDHTEPVFDARGKSVVVPVNSPAPQARRDFDAALRRADRREPEREPKEEKEEAPSGAGALGVLMPLPAAASAAWAGATETLGGAGTTALPGGAPGSLPDAVPMAAHTGAQISAGQQWRVNVPVDGQTPTSLGMRLVNTGTGHWQLKLATDAQTRQQLAPHLDRLRDKLRQRSDGRWDDLSFEDEAGASS